MCETEDVKLAELLGLPVRWDFPPYTGMTGYLQGVKYPWLYGEHEGVNYQWARVESYGSFLDAMHAVETELARRGKQRAYLAELSRVVEAAPGWHITQAGWLFAHATAAQKRAAAIVVLEASDGQ